MSTALTTIRWQAPIRSIGTKPLQHIPSEIFHEIFDYIDRHYMDTRECQESLANLSLVCHAFYTIARPQLFEYLWFSGDSKHDSSRTLSFCSAIIEGTPSAAPLAAHVKKCTFYNWMLSANHLAFNPSLDLYGQAIGCMPKLQVLTMNYVTIDENLLRDMSGLTGLRELSLFYSTFHPNITREALAIIPSLRLRSLYIEIPKTMRCAQILARIIDPTCVEWCRCSSWDIFSAIFGQLEEECSLNEVLLIETKNDTVLQKILRLCPAMKDLRFTYMMPCVRAPTPLPPSAMPDLHTVDCTAGMLPELIPNRRIHSIGIPGIISTAGPSEILGPNRALVAQLPPMGLADVGVLKSSAVDIHLLEVPSHFFFAVSFSKHFPCLRILELDFTHPNYSRYEICPQSKTDFEDTIENLCKATAPMPSINRVNLTFGPLKTHWSFHSDLVLQRRLITRICTAFPNVENISFETSILWNRDVETRDWRASVPRKERTSVLAAYHDGHAGIQDYNGCFASFLPSMS